MVDHYVTVLSITDKHVEIGDPLEGKIFMSHELFREKWRKTGILVEKQNQIP
jgi:predicted double-glycine peptidase